jgi:hypothetical protein
LPIRIAQHSSGYADSACSRNRSNSRFSSKTITHGNQQRVAHRTPMCEIVRFRPGNRTLCSAIVVLYIGLEVGGAEFFWKQAFNGKETES